MKYLLTSDERAFCDRVICAGVHAVKYHTLALVEECLAEEVPGDFAECGVMAGAHPAVMLYVLKKHGVRDRKVHLFDSFQGIARATTNDDPGDQVTYGLHPGRMESSGVSVSSVQNTLNHIANAGVYDPALIVIHEGWFEETMERDAKTIDHLAILRVDVDLYEASRLAFQHLYPKLSSGGFAIDDDYGSYRCRAAMESVIGPQDAILVEDQPTTAWWRKR